MSVRYSACNVLFTGASAETAGLVAVEANQEPKPFMGQGLLLGLEQGLQNPLELDPQEVKFKIQGA